MRAFNVTLRQAQGDCHGELVEPCISNYAHVNNMKILPQRGDWILYSSDGQSVTSQVSLVLCLS
jgi:hypothetical protein